MKKERKKLSNEELLENIKLYLKVNKPGSSCLGVERRAVYIIYATIKCENGHIWTTKFSHIKSGHWCAACLGIAKKSLTDVQIFLDHNYSGYVCISDDYFNTHIDLNIKCNKGHSFKISYKHLVQNSVAGKCPICHHKRRRRLSIGHIQNYLDTNHCGSKCIKMYHKINNIKTYLLIDCGNGHQFGIRSDALFLGTWCQKCRKIKSKNEIIAIITERCSESKLLDENYVNDRYLMSIYCGNGHQWKINANNLKDGHWCPKCSESFGETITRKYFEEIFGFQFPKVRPNWLKNPITGYNLELDGYCAELNIAFEYQGDQHFKKIPFFKMTDERLILSQQRDQFKRNLCQKMNISLIEVPQLTYYFRKDDLYRLIIDACLKLNISPKNT